MSMSQLYDKAWRTIICPFRVRHKLMSLGPIEQNVDGKQVIRVDIQFTSSRNKKLSGFVSYSPDNKDPDLIVYLHGNGGSKTDATELIKCVAKCNISVAAFDFVGCGNSQDGYLTYGVYESQDVGLFLNEVRKIVEPKSITIWGRSMGAVTAIMFAQKYGQMVDKLVLDGPFRHLTTIVQRASQEASRMPMAIISLFLFFVKRRVDSQLSLNETIFSMDYMKYFKNLKPHISVLFIYSHYDTIVLAQEVFEFFNECRGQKETCQIYETHDQDRKNTLFVEVVKWLKRVQPTQERLKLMTEAPYGTQSIVRSNGCC